MKHQLHLFILTAIFACVSCGKEKKYPIVPENTTYLSTIDSLVEDAVAESKIPGAVVCVVRDDKVEMLKAYGYRQVYPDTLPMTCNTQFDLASLSKCVGTGMSIMSLVERGLLDIEAPMSTYLSEYEPFVDSLGVEGREQKVIDFLTHTSGLPAYASYLYLLRDNPYASKCERRDSLLHYMATCPRRAAAGTDFEYSCLNFISLQYALEKVSGMPLNEYAVRYVFKPLGMNNTTYYPIGSKASNMYALECEKKVKECALIVAPTEKITAWNAYDVVPSILFADYIHACEGLEFETGNAVDENSTWEEYVASQLPKYKACYEAIVHDPLAREINAGVSGNAGVFSTAEDLSKMVIWMLNADKMKGPFSKETLEKMTTVPAGYEAFGRALAWDSYSDYSGNKGEMTSKHVICHTGYTGTSMVVDFEKRIGLIILTNRAHPEDGGGVAAMRKQVADAVFGSY